VAKKQYTKSRPAYWISGNYYDSQKKFRELFADKNLNIENIECGYNADSCPRHQRTGQAVDIILLLKNEDMFDDRTRLIRMLGCPPDYTIIYDYLGLVDDSTQLVITTPKPEYLTPAGRGVRHNSVAASNFYKILKKWGHAFDFPETAKNDNEACRWLQGVADDLGGKIDPDVIKFLVELKGRGLDPLYGELTKLIDYKDGNKITKEDVETACVPFFTKTTWDLVDALDGCLYESAIDHLEKFFQVAGTEVGKSFYTECFMLMSAIRHHFIFLLMLRCQKTVSFNTATKVFGDGEFKRKSTKDGEVSWDRDVYEYNYIRMNLQKPEVQQVLRWSEGKMHQVVLDLDRCQLACRIHSSEEEFIRRSMELFVMLVCNKLSLEQVLEARGKTFGFIY